MGFASRFEYRNWDLGFALRASLGNYVYNDAFASTSNMSNSEIYVKSKFLVNRPTDVVADNGCQPRLHLLRQTTGYRMLLS